MLSIFTEPCSWPLNRDRLYSLAASSLYSSHMKKIMKPKVKCSGAFTSGENSDYRKAFFI